MRKAVIFYFSGTGNTWWVAKKIAQKLRDTAMKVQTVSIESIDEKKADELIKLCDVVGFGYPIYCSDMPSIMKEFMQKLGEHQGKQTFVFCTQEAFSGDGARVATEFLEHTGLEIEYAIHINMPNNITAAISPLSYRYTSKDKDAILRKADEKLDKFIYYILEEIPGKIGFNKSAKVLGSIQRTPYRKLYKRATNMISFNSKCTHCSYCEKICPVDNITVTPHGNITYNRCIQCMRCYNYCPHTAVRIFGVSHNEKRGETYKGPIRDFNPMKLKNK